MFFRRANKIGDLVYEISKSFPKFELYELGSQMRRSADSIVFNIAEGGGKKSVADMTNYLRIALGSVKELKVQFGKVESRGYLNQEECVRIKGELDEVGKMINGFIRKLKDK